MAQLLLIVLFLFSPPSVHLNWKTATRSSVAIAVDVKDEFIERCGLSGLTVRYRYSLQLCRSRSWWFDECGDERMLIRTFRYDPITELFYLSSDLIGDRQSATTATGTTIQEAFRYVQKIEDFPLQTLLSSSGNDLPRKDGYLTVSVSAGCKSEYSETFARVSSVLSLGMVTSGVVESGRITFMLDQ